MLKLYTTGCPKCVILKKKLTEKGVLYEEITDTQVMSNLGITMVPVLEVDGRLFSFAEAVNWVNNYEA